VNAHDHAQRADGLLQRAARIARDETSDDGSIPGDVLDEIDSFTSTAQAHALVSIALSMAAATKAAAATAAMSADTAAAVRHVARTARGPRYAIPDSLPPLPTDPTPKGPAHV
jgi:hypothetical protein